MQHDERRSDRDHAGTEAAQDRVEGGGVSAHAQVLTRSAHDTAGADGDATHAGEPDLGTRWTPADAAEDLLGQVRDLIHERAPAGAIARALEAEGLRHATAEGVVRAVGGPLLVWRDDPEGEMACGIDLAPLRRSMHVSHVHPGGDHDRLRLLADALTADGLPPSLAHDVTAEFVVTWRRLHDLRRDRLRRLGVQGLVAGLLFAGYFAWTATLGGRAAPWNLVTAAVSLALAVYGALLWRRNREMPQPTP